MNKASFKSRDGSRSYNRIGQEIRNINNMIIRKGYQAYLDYNSTDCTMLHHSLGDTLLVSKSLQSRIGTSPKVGMN